MRTLIIIVLSLALAGSLTAQSVYDLPFASKDCYVSEPRGQFRGKN